MIAAIVMDSMKEPSSSIRDSPRRSEMLPRWESRRFVARAAKSRRDCRSRRHSTAVRAECYMQQGITKTQPKGKLGKVVQQPVMCEWLTIASMSHQMRLQKRLHCISGELE